MASERFLADTSAIFRQLNHKEVFETWRGHIRRGLIAVIDATAVELLYSARSAEHYTTLSKLLHTAYIPVHFPDRAWRRAREVQKAMVDQGTHRSAGLADLLVASTAEAHGLTVLHDDRDFDCIAAVTGQPTRRVN
jgi:predicted nucleic acid-binding protein